MKKVVAILSISLTAGLFSTAANAAKPPAFTSQNYSGTYSCKGSNESVGDYDVTATIKLKRLSSYAKFGTYDFSTQTSNSVVYSGQAVADGSRLALTYRLNDKQSTVFTTGIAEIKKNSQGLWTFHNYYYEADDTGGNYGHELCVLKPDPNAVKPVKKPVTKPKPAAKPAQQPAEKSTQPTTSDFIPQTPE